MKIEIKGLLKLNAIKRRLPQVSNLIGSRSILICNCVNQSRVASRVDRDVQPSAVLAEVGLAKFGLKKGVQMARFV